MNLIKVISCFLSIVFVTGCASVSPQDGARGPELVGGGRSTESGHYAEVGVEFSTWGDFVALVSPKRWKSPIATGGSLSWLNPVAWSDDAGRTGRILLGEAVVIGGAVAAAGAYGSDDGSSSAPPPDSSSPPPPPGDGGGVPPPPEF